MAKIEMRCALLNLGLAEKYMRTKNLELASHRVQDARKSLEVLEKLIKKSQLTLDCQSAVELII